MLSVCAWCKKVKINFLWVHPTIHSWIHHHPDKTHGICPDCKKDVDREMEQLKAEKVVV